MSGGFNAKKFVTGTSYTSFDISGAAKTNGKVIASGKTLNMLSQQFTYRGLPTENTEFGNKTVTLNINSPDAPGLTSPQVANVQVFFNRDAKNHPAPNQGQTPNWYYYWDDLSSVTYGTHIYNPTYSYCLTAWNPTTNTWDTIINTGALGPFSVTFWVAGSGKSSIDGIDGFANVCRHEAKHRADFLSWWPNNENSKQDGDGDFIPDSLEKSDSTNIGLPFHPGTKGYNPTKKATFKDMYHYNAGDRWSDDKDYTLNTEVGWSAGSADNIDWFSPGHQY